MAPMRLVNYRNADELRPRKQIEPEGPGSTRDEGSTLRGEEMTVQCGICEYAGSLVDAPPFLCFNCCDAIRRLVWISEQEQGQAERREPVENDERAGVSVLKPAVLGKRQAR